MSAKACYIELCVNSPWGRDWNSCLCPRKIPQVMLPSSARKALFLSPDQLPASFIKPLLSKGLPGWS